MRLRRAPLPLRALLLACATGLSSLFADEAPKIRLGFHLGDGSQLMAAPVLPTLAVRSRLGGVMELKWSALDEVSFEAGPEALVARFSSGDRLTAALTADALEVDCLLGRLSIPAASVRSIRVDVMGGAARNVALGKPVHGADGASHGQGLARHLTDGDPATHAKPPASAFDYRIDLQAGAEASYGIEEIVIDWGHFGDQFLGVREQGGGNWSGGAWPGEYVTSYTVEYRRLNEEDWRPVHEFKGRPVDEKAEGVLVEKRPTQKAGCSSESVTRLQGLRLRGVAELRIRATGGHWIGLFELEALGWQE